MELDGESCAVGTVYPHRRRGVESATFRYADSYLVDRRAYPIDPQLPLIAGSLQTPVGRPTFGAFGDTSPDRWGRNLLLREERRRAAGFDARAIEQMAPACEQEAAAEARSTVPDR